MSELKKMIAETKKKIDQANTGFCSTSEMTATELTKRAAKSLLLGQGNVDELIDPASKKLDKKYKTKKTCT